jgi:hypothetical protein
MCKHPHMPDNDILPRGIRRAWRDPAALAIGGHRALLVADECDRALAREIRESAETGLVTLAEKLSEAVSAEDPISYFETAASLTQGFGHSPFANAVAAEGESLLVGGRSGSVGARELLEGGLRRYADAALFGSEQMLKRMHERGGIPLDRLDDYRAAVVELVRTKEIAEAVLRQPGGQVRAPARRDSTTTAEMLSEVVH